MTRLLITADGPGTAACPAKNLNAAPGLPNRSHDRSERNTMVDTTPLTRATANTVTYAPRELNALVTREIAGRLREVADTLTDNVLFLLLSDLPGPFVRSRSNVYLDVASQLLALANHELDGIALRGEAA